jgi:hypothetical protein
MEFLMCFVSQHGSCHVNVVYLLARPWRPRSTVRSALSDILALLAGVDLLVARDVVGEDVPDDTGVLCDLAIGTTPCSPECADRFVRTNADRWARSLAARSSEASKISTNDLSAATS